MNVLVQARALQMKPTGKPARPGVSQISTTDAGTNGEARGEHREQEARVLEDCRDCCREHAKLLTSSTTWDVLRSRKIAPSGAREDSAINLTGSCRVTANDLEVASRLGQLLDEMPQKKREKAEQKKGAEMPGQWCMMGCMLGWEETARRCVNEATTVGVISALLAGITFPALMAPPEVSANPFSNAVGNRVAASLLLRLYSYGVFLSMGFSIVCVILCATLIMQLNITTTADDIRGFFLKFEYLTGLNVACFNGSLLCLVGTLVCTMAVNFHATDTTVALVLMAVAWFALVVLVGHIYLNFSLRNIQRHYAQLMEVNTVLQRVTVRNSRMGSMTSGGGGGGGGSYSMPPTSPARNAAPPPPAIQQPQPALQQQQHQSTGGAGSSLLSAWGAAGRARAAGARSDPDGGGQPEPPPWAATVSNEDD